MTVIHGLDRKKGLDLILHTPGGETAATESLVVYLLGEEFQGSITQGQHIELYGLANRFVLEELDKRRARDSKLAFRYSHLAHYFDAHPPSEAGESEAQPVDAPAGDL